MQTTATLNILTTKVKTARLCLACGTLLPPRNRRYCSMLCKQNLLASLNRRAGLLRALNTRYATFYFTDYMIMMDLLPYDNQQIHSYLLPRRSGNKPVEDFCALSNILSSVWWYERDRTKKRYLASQFVLEQANKSKTAVGDVIPSELVVPAVKNSSLISLDLGSADLTPSNLENRIKSAYRRQVKKHHPDIGGSAQAFVKIQEAYEMLLQWAKHPTYKRRRGFPDKWLYEGANDRWVQPSSPNNQPRFNR